jgi:membrane protein DedA with SNARE-associated domain
MAQLLDQLRIWMQASILVLGYPGVALFMFAGSLVPFIPSIIVMPFAGSLVAEGRLAFSSIITAGVIGTTTGTSVMYYLGRQLGEHRMRSWLRRYATLSMLDAAFCRALEWFDRRGRAVLFFGRVIPGLRNVVSLPAGMRRIRFATFLALTIPGVLAWHLMLGVIGLLLGENWVFILRLVSVYEMALWILVAGLAGLLLVRRLMG